MREVQPKDLERRLDDFLLESIQEGACDGPQEFLNLYYFSISGFGIQPDAKCRMLRAGDEIRVLYGANLLEYNYFNN